MLMWTIYDNPRDYPGKCVARLFRGGKPTAEALVADDLEALRIHMLLNGLVCLTRDDADDPVIVEVWL